MTPEQRKAARERCEKATPGPWVIEETVLGDFCVGPPDTGDVIAGSKPDAYFVACAREDLPAALDALDAAEEENARLRGRLAQTERELAETQEAWNAVVAASENVDDPERDRAEAWKAYAQALARGLRIGPTSPPDLRDISDARDRLRALGEEP